jgi:hypothetical protein
MNNKLTIPIKYNTIHIIAEFLKIFKNLFSGKGDVIK